MNAVTVVVMTEFGRRVAENSSFGTDHGRDGSMLVMGGTERGNVLGEMPVIETGILVGPGDVPVVKDYRDVLRPILARHGAGRAMGKIFQRIRSAGWDGEGNFVVVDWDGPGDLIVDWFDN